MNDQKLWFKVVNVKKNVKYDTGMVIIIKLISAT